MDKLIYRYRFKKWTKKIITPQLIGRNVDELLFQNYTVVLKDNFAFEQEIFNDSYIDPSQRGHFEVDEVLEHEQLDDELEAKILEEHFAKLKKKDDKKKSKKWKFW